MGHRTFVIATGHSLWSNFASSYLQFDFDTGTLGAFPTHVGLVSASGR